MRVSYRNHGGNKAYWQDRWDKLDEGDSGELNRNRYPGKYAELLISQDLPEGAILEAGCGGGRVALHFHRMGTAIVGMDFIESILVKIQKIAPDLPLVCGDITHLPFPDKSYAGILAFGLFHNLMEGPLDAAIQEAHRVLKSGGNCAPVSAWTTSRITLLIGPQINPR